MISFKCWIDYIGIITSDEYCTVWRFMVVKLCIVNYCLFTNNIDCRTVSALSNIAYEYTVVNFCIITIDINSTGISSWIEGCIFVFYIPFTIWIWSSLSGLFIIIKTLLAFPFSIWHFIINRYTKWRCLTFYFSSVIFKKTIFNSYIIRYCISTTETIMVSA